MEKSIESIWKQGFINSDALVAPKLNKLYNQKSIHIIDKFKRMFRINLNAIVAGSILFLGISFVIGIPYMGIGFFLTLSIIVIVNRRLSRGLNKIDKSESSYQYIKAFDNWMKQQVSVNRIMARFYYPLFFLSGVLGFWQYHFNGKQLGEAITNKLILNYPGIDLIFGVPLFIILGVILMMVMLSYFGGKLYQWDLKVVYGGVLRKLDEIIADMEELRNT
ncbi:MAG: hypothetical protein KJ578_12250 [Bacteroidetes bacterium]|nr:hypothetical protein [Bacteroidota bacterium]MBU1578231.1 hypothetical protein [Bacteroidota bacterium]MBU2558542.1 hypothetical protein [Bacteroidota bacterium]